jgi:hypothetical protein
VDQLDHQSNSRCDFDEGARITQSPKLGEFPINGRRDKCPVGSPRRQLVSFSSRSWVGICRTTCLEIGSLPSYILSQDSCATALIIQVEGPLRSHLSLPFGHRYRRALLNDRFPVRNAHIFDHLMLRGTHLERPDPADDHLEIPLSLRSFSFLSAIWEMTWFLLSGFSLRFLVCHKRSLELRRLPVGAPLTLPDDQQSLHQNRGHPQCETGSGFNALH